MANQGFMRIGSQAGMVGIEKLELGQMGIGAVKRSTRITKKEEEKARQNVLVVDKKNTDKKTVEGDSKSDVDLSNFHPSTLKKMAIEKGYDGKEFDKETLIKFLNN